MTHDWRAIVRAGARPADPALEPAIVDEFAQHLADLYDEAIGAGLSEQEALFIARSALPAERQALAGDLDRAARSLPGLIVDRWGAADAPAVRASRVGGLFSGIRRDVIYACRSLLQAPGYTVVVLFTLALGIGTNAAIFAAVDTILLRPMPFARADRLVVPMSVNAARDIDDPSVSFADHTDWKELTDIFEAVALWRPRGVDLVGAGPPERVRAVQVSPEYFRVIAVTPLAGRTLTDADFRPDAPGAMVISHALWQRAFGGAADAVGRTVRVAGVPMQVAGILPPRTSWPVETDLFVAMPAAMPDDVRTRRDNLIFYSVALLREGVDIEVGNEALHTIAARIEAAHPGARQGWTNRLSPLRDFMVDRNVGRALWVLMAAVGAVLLIACANLANLGLVRGLGRARELSVRVALGASRWRLVRQLAVEHLVICVAGAAAGAGVASWLITALAAMAPAGTPFVDQMGFDMRVLAATAVLTGVATVLVGLLPAITAARVPAASALKDGSAGAGSSRGIRMLRHGLIVAEVAGAAMLLCSAAVLGRSFWHLSTVDTGVDVDRVITARLTLPRSPRYAQDAQVADFFTRVVDRLAAAPGVASAGATSFTPVGGGGFGLGRVFLADGSPEPPAGPEVSAQWNVVTPDYFRTLGIPVLQGRSFTPQDRAGATQVVMVSRGFARQAFGEADPIGKRIRSWRDENRLREIVGVVDEVRYWGLAETDIVRQVYVPHGQDSWGFMNVVVRSTMPDPAALEPVIRREIAALDSELAVSNVATLGTLAGDSIAEQRSTTMLLAVLAATALALGAIGIYGVISHAVSLRRRELAVRAALGGTPHHLYALVLREGLGLTTVGLALGLAGAISVSRVLEALLFETPSRDPLAFGAACVVIALVGTIACLGPARRAARMDPLAALKAE